MFSSPKQPITSGYSGRHLDPTLTVYKDPEQRVWCEVTSKMFIRVNHTIIPLLFVLWWKKHQSVVLE